MNNHTKMYVTYTRIYGWSDYGGESSYQPGYRLENMMWMTLLVYDYIIPGENACVYKTNGGVLETIITNIDIHTKERKSNGCGYKTEHVGLGLRGVSKEQLEKGDRVIVKNANMYGM